jgi:transcription initiation factor TFIID subunit TAF12
MCIEKKKFVNIASQGKNTSLRVRAREEEMGSKQRAAKGAVQVAAGSNKCVARERLNAIFLYYVRCI